MNFTFLEPANPILEMLSLTHADFVVAFFLFPLFFFAFWKLASKNLFEPFLKLYEAREKATEGAELDADQYLQEAEAIESEVADTILAARKEAVEQKLQGLQEAGSRAADKVHKAENEASAYLNKGREEIEVMRAKLEAELSSQVDDMVESIVQSVKQPPELAQAKRERA